MSEKISRSDWLYKEPTNLSGTDDSGADTGGRSEHPERRASKAKQGGREYYEAAKNSEQLQELLKVYFNRTRDVSDLRQEVVEGIEKEYPDRFSKIEQADHRGLGFAAKALAEDGILEADVYETSPSEDNPNAKLVGGVPHWECGTCNLVIRSISDDLVSDGREPTICPVCNQPL
jgi:rubrerythrin